MKLTPPYRQKIALLLLLLYMFIATPVHYWHHHAGCTGGGEGKVEKQLTTVSKVAHAHNVSASPCNICSHQYAVYSNDATVVILPQRAPFFTLYVVPSFAVATQAVHAFSNKGPPCA